MIRVEAELKTLEEIKELLADLEVLNQKYNLELKLFKSDYSLVLEDFSVADTTEKAS